MICFVYIVKHIYNGVCLMGTKGFHIRIDSEMLDKLHYIAQYEGRTATGQLVYMVRKLVEEFEEKHGEIPTDTRRSGKKD